MKNSTAKACLKAFKEAKYGKEMNKFEKLLVKLGILATDEESEVYS